MTGMEALGYLAARVLTCGIWAAAGLHSLTHFEQTAMGMASRGIPASKPALVVVLAMKAVGIALLLANAYVWAVCLVWAAFLVPASYIYHRKFVTPEGGIDFMQYVLFWKNVSLIGGLLALLLLDPSRPDWLLRG